MSDAKLTPAEMRATDEYAERKAAGETDSAIIASMMDDAADAAEGDEAPKEEGDSGPGDETGGGSPEETSKPLDDMTFDELMVVAQDLDIAGRSTMDKRALFEAIVSHQD